MWQEYSVISSTPYAKIGGAIVLIGAIPIGVIWAARCLLSTNRRKESVKGLAVAAITSMVLGGLASSTSFESFRFNATTIELNPQGLRAPISFPLSQVSEVEVASFTHRLRKNYLLRIKTKGGASYNSVASTDEIALDKIRIAAASLRRTLENQPDRRSSK